MRDSTRDKNGAPRKSTRSMRRVSARPPKLSQDAVPKRTAKCHTALAIDMKDAFVLAQVDGATAVSELAAIAGIDGDALAAILGRLVQAGAVELPGARRHSRPPPEKRAPSVRIPAVAVPATPSKARIRVAMDRGVGPSGPVSVPDVVPGTSRSATSIAPVKRKRGADPLEALRRFFDDKVDQEGRKRARVFVEAGEYELARGNVVAAATQFQLALNCCDAPEIRQALEAVEERALARRFELAAAEGEAREREARWAEAATAYAKAHAARPTARVADRLANALRLSLGDMRQAAKLAEDAVRQEPDNAGYRVTLGEVYADAGLDRRAEAESARALKLAPQDPRASALAERLAKKPRAR